MEVTDEEYRKADLDWSYSPKEECTGVIEAETEVHAGLKLARYIKSGTYGKAAQLQQVEG